jgi:MoxR-like ATPase
MALSPAARGQRQRENTPSNGAAVGGNLAGAARSHVGRDGTIAALTTQMAPRRLLTIVGPIGIGKTTVAAAVARTVSAF